MKVVIFGLLCLCGLWGNMVWGQDIRTYSGDFNLKSYPGKCTYSYYENKEMQRVRHGGFNFSATLKSAAGGNIIVSIVGKYEHGAATGAWTFSRVVTNLHKESVTGSFVGGKQTGTWVFKREGKLHTYTGTFVYAKGNMLEYKINSTGVAIADNYSVTGKATAENYVTGTVNMDYKYKQMNLKETREYDKGKLYKQVVIDKQTGEFLYNKTIDSTTLSIMNLLEGGTPSEDLGYKFSENVCRVESGWMTETRVVPCDMVGGIIYTSLVAEMRDLEFKPIGIRYLVPAKTRAELAKEEAEAAKKRAAWVAGEKNRVLRDLQENKEYAWHTAEKLDSFAGHIGEINVLMKEGDDVYNNRLSKGDAEGRLALYKVYQAFGDTLKMDMNDVLKDDIDAAIAKSMYVETHFVNFKRDMQLNDYPQVLKGKLEADNQAKYAQIVAERAPRAAQRAANAEKRKAAEAALKAQKEREAAELKAQKERETAELKAQKERETAAAKLKEEQLSEINKLKHRNSDNEYKLKSMYAPQANTGKDVNVGIRGVNVINVKGKAKNKYISNAFNILSGHYQNQLKEAKDLATQLNILQRTDTFYNWLLKLDSKQVKQLDKQLKNVDTPAEIERIFGF